MTTRAMGVDRTNEERKTVEKQGTYEEGELIRLVWVLKKYRVDVLSAQETKLSWNDLNKIGKCVLFTSDAEDVRLKTGFLVNETMERLIVDVC